MEAGVDGRGDPLVSDSDSSSNALPPSEYVVVLRAPSSARFLPEEGFEQRYVPDPAVGFAGAQVRLYSRWVDEGQAEPLPRELVVEVRITASSLDVAITQAAALARPLVTLVGFVANVRVGQLEAHLAYDASPEKEERQFVEVFLPDETGGVSEGRFIRVDLLVAARNALHLIGSAGPRLERALRQYELALRHWYLGGEFLALSHLYMAVEALTPAVLDAEIAARCTTREALAESVGIVTDDPQRPRWKPALDAWCREQVIFCGDVATYQAAKGGSDGFEHGYLDLDDVQRRALTAASQTFRYVRTAVVRLLDLADDARDGLLSLAPKDAQSRRKVIRGRLVGVAEDPAPLNERYPRLEWTTRHRSVDRDGSTFTFAGEENLTVRAHPDVGFAADRFEIVGRLEEGQAAVGSLGDIDVVHAPANRPRQLLGAAMVLSDAASGSGTVSEVPLAFPRPLAFLLFGQGVAFFQAGLALLDADQPVEATLPLKGLIRVASHFDEMTRTGGPGLGLVIRLAIESLDRSLEAPADPATLQRLTKSADERRREWLEAAAGLGLTVPDRAAEPTTGMLWDSLGAEVRLSDQVASADFLSLWLHTRAKEDDALAFQTKVPAGPLTDMVATAFVIAHLSLVRLAAVVFDWKVDEAQVEDNLSEARTLNERAAQDL